MNIATVKTTGSGGPITAKVAVPQFPQSSAGVIWRYNTDQTFDTRVGIFTTEIQEVPLGAPESISGKHFLVEGAVLHHNDNPPSPYQVVVAILQGGKEVHKEVPPEGGTGQIGDKNVPFIYRFVVELE